ncbi:hypothetical protein PLESTM_001303100 [Pleodorina starrii]|nr:hypothetical protein PLESTM_001303100 [Pleodorina starrii]
MYVQLTTTRANSISWGQGASDRGKTDWFSVFVKWLESVSKQKVYGKNGCVPASPASYMVVCLELYVEPDVDLVFIEYVFNDGLDNKVVDNHVVIAMEQLVRRLMALPGHPAVVLVQVPHVRRTELLPFHQTSEDLEGALAAYYGLSTVSLRNSLFPLNVVQPTSGYLFNETYPEHHPGDSGHKMIADLAVHLIQETALGLMTNPVRQAEEEAWGRPLADPPMYLGNFPPETSSCIAGERFRSQVLSHKGWEWVNEGTEEKPKWGYVTTTSGSSLLVRVNTTQGSTLDAATLANATMPVIVQFLRSYTRDMGFAVVRCVEGCSCKDHPISGWHTLPFSETGMTGMAVRLTPGFTSCDLLFNVTDKRRNNGGHKFKLIGVVTTAVGYDFSATYRPSSWHIPDK